MTTTSENKHLEYVLNLLTYDDLDEQQKIEACVEYIRNANQQTPVVFKGYSSQLFMCSEDVIMKPHHDTLQLDLFSDDEDGTFPHVMSFQKLAKAINEEGSSAWLNWATVQTSVENREYCGDGFKLHWKANKEVCTIEFDKPTPFMFSRVGHDDVVCNVELITGMVTCEPYYMRGPRRQSKYPNAYDVVFNILSFEA
jgi:hypothetical protein